jgi:oligoendopeptidase F
MDAKIDAQLEQIQQRAKTFRETYEGHLDPASSSSSDAAGNDKKSSLLLEAVQAFEAIGVDRAKISSYLSLSYDVDLDNDALKKRKGEISQRQSAIVGDYLEWFELDVANLDNDAIQFHLTATPDLAKYMSYLDELRRSRPHNLEKNVERALTVRSPYTGTRPLVSFLDKELSLMRFQLDDEDSAAEKVNMEVLLSRMQSSKDAAFRAKCLKVLNDGLGGHVSRVAALSLSSVAGSWLVENRERNYTNLRSARNLSNNCPDAVVDSLLQGVQTAGVPLCKRYYGLKKQILQTTQGLETFRWSDRNAPIDICPKDEDDGKISWETAVAMVQRGYAQFSPKMAQMFIDMVQEKRIDVPAVNGKKGGAYCAGVVPGIGPFQLLNFDGTKQDVATLAHESGHGCHDIVRVLTYLC